MCWLRLPLFFDGSTSFAPVSVLRIIRLVRLARAFKVMMMCPELHDLVKAMASAARITLWGTVFISALIMVWAIVAVQLVYPITLELACQTCPNAWRSVWHASVTLTQLLVASDAWGEVCNPIIAHSPWTLYLFGAMLLSTQLLIFNLILAVIVQYAQVERTKDIEMKEHKERVKRAAGQARLLKSLEDMDSDKSGTISREELLSNIDGIPDLATELCTLGIHTSELATVFDLLDNEGTGEVQYKSFVMNLQRLQSYDPLLGTIMTLQHMKLLRDHLSCSIRAIRCDEANEGIISQKPSQKASSWIPSAELPETPNCWKQTVFLDSLSASDVGPVEESQVQKCPCHRQQEETVHATTLGGYTDKTRTEDTPGTCCPPEQIGFDGLSIVSRHSCVPQQAQCNFTEFMPTAILGDAGVSHDKLSL